MLIIKTISDVDMYLGRKTSVAYKMKNHIEQIDCIFLAFFMVLSAEHPMVLKTNLPVDPIGGNLIDHRS